MKKYNYVCLVIVLCALLAFAWGCGKDAPENAVAEPADESESWEEHAIAEAEDILYERLLTYLNGISYEETEAMREEKDCLYAVKLAPGTDVAFLTGCSAAVEEDIVVPAVKYRNEYRLILQQYMGLQVEIPSSIRKSEEGAVSPNAVFRAQEEMRLPIVQDEMAEVLHVRELVIEKGAECRLDLLYEKGKAEIFGARYAVGEDAVIESRRLTREDLAVAWFDENAVKRTPVRAGEVLYQLDDCGDTVCVAGGLGGYSVTELPKEWMIPLDFIELREKLPAGEYVFITHADFCDMPPGDMLGIHPYREEIASAGTVFRAE